MRQNIKNGYDIIDGVIWKQILIFFFPILLGSFFQQLYNTADAVIVGRFVGKEALSAVGGSTGTLINLLVGFFVGLSSGATVIISQYYGARDNENVNTAVHTAIAMAIVGGAVLMVCGILISPIALKAMGTPADVIDYAITYIRIYFVGMIANLIYNIGAGILRAVGDSKRPLYFLIVSCFVNIVLDILFVVSFKWGVAGVAVATVLSQCVSAALVLLVLAKTNLSYRLEFRKIKIDFKKLTQIFKIGLPAGLQSSLYSISNIIIQSTVNLFGTNTVAAWTAFTKIDGIFWMMMGAFGVSITTFVGQNYGAKKMSRVKSSVKQCFAMTTIATVVMCVVIYITGQYLYLMFTDDAAVIEMGVKILKLFVPTYITYISIEILSGALRGMGNSLIPMLLTGFGVCGLRIVWIFFAVPVNPTIDMVIYSYPISWIVTSVLFIIYYNYYMKKKKEIIIN